MTEHRTPYDAGNSTQAPSDPLPCGHPRAAVRCANPDGKGDTTCWCGWCADVGAARAGAGRWAAVWKRSARANHDAYQDAQLNFQEAMRQYDAQQKRACKAEAQVLALREILGRVVSTADTFSDGEDAINLLAEIAREGLLVHTPAALDELLERTRKSERRRCHAIAMEIAAQRRAAGDIATDASLAVEQVAAAILEEDTCGNS